MGATTRTLCLSTPIGSNWSRRFCCGVWRQSCSVAVCSLQSVGIFNTSGLAVGLITDEIKLNSAWRFAPNLPENDKFYCVEIDLTATVTLIVASPSLSQSSR